MYRFEYVYSIQNIFFSRPHELSDGLVRFRIYDSLNCRHIKDALERTQWNITKAAELLGISRFALQRRIKKYFN
ncbi:helix-turn-helix domain-containing protein [Thermosediminibacter litoriperuensis]|uniref:helix-turn-helix domain-containing protein n=1 Tax=Thermosediminibacter litoriperuensis TaxID=291989 RepID=UPI001CA416A0|nr:helix-turn-helix domain-containing protein [Thermosediminibacter litoriperuensis]